MHNENKISEQDYKDIVKQANKGDVEAQVQLAQHMKL